MIETTRKNYTPAQSVALVTQVSSVCPLCAEPLFYRKGRASYKNYDIAHIYPLNPTIEEAELLKDEERLHEDVNHENNLIPLCKICHGKFDKPRTVKEYRELLDLKRKFIQESEQKALWKQYQIENDIDQIIEAIYKEDIDEKIKINFAPTEVNRKLNSTISKPTARKIISSVTNYFLFIKERLALMDTIVPGKSDVISMQIKSYYSKQKSMGLSQQDIFNNIVAWLSAKTKAKTSDAAEIIVSFFIQNCEVFE